MRAAEPRAARRLLCHIRPNDSASCPSAVISSAAAFAAASLMSAGMTAAPASAGHPPERNS